MSATDAGTISAPAGAGERREGALNLRGGSRAILDAIAAARRSRRGVFWHGSAWAFVAAVMSWMNERDLAGPRAEGECNPPPRDEEREPNETVATRLEATLCRVIM